MPVARASVGLGRVFRRTGRDFHSCGPGHVPGRDQDGSLLRSFLRGLFFRHRFRVGNVHARCLRHVLRCHENCRLIDWFGCALFRYSLRISPLPALETERLLPSTETGEIDAAVFTAPAAGAHDDLERGPAGGFVGLYTPVIQVHTVAARAVSVEHVFKEDRAGDKAGFAILTAERRDEPQRVSAFLRILITRRAEMPATAIGTRQRHSSYQNGRLQSFAARDVLLHELAERRRDALAHIALRAESLACNFANG